MGAAIDSVNSGRSGERPTEPARPGSTAAFLRRRFLAILVPLVLVPGAALAFSLLQEKRYEAQTSVVFRDTGPLVASAEPEREAATNLRLLQLPGLEDRVEARLDEPLTGDVDVVAEAESNLATIIATDSDPDQAARVANAFAEEYVDLRQEDLLDEIARETEAVESALAELPSDGAREAQALGARLDELQLAALEPSGATHINPANPPSEAFSPNPVQNAVIGAVAGLALGLILAIALERKDRRVRDPRHIEHVLGRPIIGRIPRSRALARSGRTTAALPPVEADAFRTVRANLRHQLRARDARSVLVTSAIPGEGKTTIVWNLARVAAAAGGKVLLVEADMRRPALGHSLQANGAGSTGLSELLVGEAQLQDLIQPIDVQDRGNETDGATGPGSIDVLFAGTPPPNPAELLGSERMQAVLEVVPDDYDLVIIDTPPTVVSDAIPILDHVGGVVIVGRLGMSTDETLIELREQLDKLDTPTLGVIVNGARKASKAHRYYESDARG